MIRSDIQGVLARIYPVELVESMLTNYENALTEYRKGHWQYFGNELGQFVEVARRIIEYQLSDKYTPLSTRLPIFNERILTDWEKYDSKFAEEFKIIIPRCLYAMYCIRNKRGMIHKNHIDPNHMDATMLLNNAKWVLAELFRQASSLSFEETELIIDSIICKETSIVWDTGTYMRILDNKMASKDKVICLLYMKDGMTDIELQNSIEFKNFSDFKKILRALHKDKMIEYQSPKCILSPIGIKKAEKFFENS